MRKYVMNIMDKKDKKEELRDKEICEVNVNLFDGEGFLVTEELLVNYTDLGVEMMVLDLGPPVSLAGT